MEHFPYAFEEDNRKRLLKEVVIVFPFFLSFTGGRMANK